MTLSDHTSVTDTTKPSPGAIRQRRYLERKLDAARAEDQAMLYALLMTALEVGMDGRLKASVRTATVQ